MPKKKGSKYGKSLLKVASILYIIPLVNLAAGVVFIVTLERMGRIKAAGTTYPTLLAESEARSAEG